MAASLARTVAAAGRLIRRAITRVLQRDILSGVAGGLLAYMASNIWSYYFGSWPLPAVPAGSLMPDFLSFVSTDIFVGAGCGFAGYPMGREIALMLGAGDRGARLIPMLTALMLGAAIALFVNGVLLAFSFF